MASEEQAQTKRKRGRPPTASNASNNPAAAAPTTQYANADEEHQPKKRGRKRKSLEVEADNPPVKDPKPRKRGRPSLNREAAASVTATGEPAEQVEKEGGRRDQVAAAGIEKRATRKHPAAAAAAVDVGVDEDEPEQEEQQEERRQTRTRKGRRQSLQELQPSEAQNKASKHGNTEKRGRPRKSGEAPEEEPTTQSPEKRKRRQPSRDAEDQAEEPGPVKEPRVNHERQDVKLPPKRYPHVTSQVRGVKQATIDSKWMPLGPSSVAVASEILELAHRPILQRLAGTALRRQHTSAALSGAYKRITRKLQKGLPFPPAGMPSTSRGGAGDGGRETELDFESVLDGRRGLERQLDPALHAVELLKKEKDRIVRELERDYMTLRNLEAGARTQAREQREKLKRAHVLAPEASRQPRLEDVEMIFDDKGPSALAGSSFKDLEDGELKDLALQLSGHMDSIKVNLQQTDGLLPQISDSKAALRRVLLQHLDQQTAEKAVLGQ